MKTRTILTFSALTAVALALASCGGSDKTFAKSADMFVNQTVGPEYLAYVAKDQNLTADQKNDRVIDVASFRRAVAAKLAD